MSARPEGAGQGARDWAVLLRGVNVGGANKLPMAGWRRLLAEQGFRDPQTYIQSGNAVLGAEGPAEGIAAEVSAGIAAGFGFAPAAFVLPEAALAAALDHPFPGTDDLGKVHAFFLAETEPQADLARAEALRAPSEVFALRPGLLLLHAPEGIGRSKLAEALPRLVRCPLTARNLRTVAAVHGMLRSRRREDRAG